jgi:hypothetical protein
MTAETARPALDGGGGRTLRLSPTAAVRILQVVLWVLVATGPIAALVVASQLSSLDDRLDSIAVRPAAEPATDTAGARGVAELFVASYVTAHDDSADGPWMVMRTVSLGTEDVAPGYVAVTVAVDLSGPDGPATWFYSVGVAETAGGWAATGLPALVAAPPRGEAPAVLLDESGGVDVGAGIETLLVGFLSAYLTGDGELTRYTSPTASIVSAQPPPFVQVEIEAATAAEPTDDLTPVSVLVQGTDFAGRTQFLEYSLTVSQRDGRWEVSELLPAPLLSQTDTD